MRMYRDREQAGEVLAASLLQYAGHPSVTVLGLVRGGVPVAARVAIRLDAALDALVVRKLGLPWSPELAFGALGPGGVRVLTAMAGRLSAEDIAEVTRVEAVELDRREARYRTGRPPLALAGRVAIVVDDGLATGSTAQAAVQVVYGLGPAQVVLAVPVGSRPAVDWLAGSVPVVCPLVVDDFGAVSRYFESFPQVEDDTVIDLLASAARRPASGPR